MRSERAHLFSKPQAFGCLVLVAVLALGGMENISAFEASPVVVLYLLLFVSMLLLPTITPGAGEFAKGIRRAEKAGRARPRFWDDLALNRLVLALFCLVVLVGATLAGSLKRARPLGSGGDQSYSYSVAIPVGVFVVAYFGLAYQYFLLAFPRRGRSLFGLFLFMVWLVPIVVAAILLGAGLGEQLASFTASLSPLVGIALSVGQGEHRFGQLPQIAALGPAIGFAFLFNNLVVVARRRIEREVHTAPRVSTTRPAQSPGPLLEQPLRGS
jgi:hypothetical protein